MKLTLRKYGINGLEIILEAHNVHIVEDVVEARRVKMEDGSYRSVGSDVADKYLDMFIDITSDLILARNSPFDYSALEQVLRLAGKG